MRLAKRAIDLLEGELRLLLESHCLLDPATHQPLRETIDDDVAVLADELEKELEQARATVAQAGG